MFNMPTVKLSMLAGAGAQFFDNNGNPLAGGKLYTYEAGTTIPQTAYVDNTGNTPHSNPIILDSAGRPNEIWLIDGESYKFIIKTSADVTIAMYDNIEGNGSGILSVLAAGSGASLIGYEPAGTEAVTTDVQTKLRETVSVKDFGAYNDGTNAAQTTEAIQAAIDYAQAQSNVHCVEFPTGNYAVNSPISVKGNFGYGFFIKGNKSTIIATHDGIVFDCDSGSPSPAPAYRLNFNISDITIVGPGKSNANAVGIKLYGANYSLNHVILTGFHRALYGHGCLISEFVQCKFEDSEYGIWFDFDGYFAPNDNHFYKCNIIGCVQAIKYIDFDYGAVTFIGCEIEGNNISGNATDGVKVCEFGVGPSSGAGETTFIGCHWESNPGQYNLYYDSPNGRHLNIIGCKMIPGDTTGSIIYMNYGELFVTGSHVAQNVGGNIVLTANTGNAMIVGDTAGVVTGVMSKLIRAKSGTLNVGGMNSGATVAGIQGKGILGIGAAIEGAFWFNDSSGGRLGYITNNNIVLDASAAYTINTGYGGVSFCRASNIGIDPINDNTLSLGSPSLRWSTVYAGTGTINTSDENSKEQIEEIPQSWLDAWGDVEYCRFKFKDAVSAKGGGARWHVGAIAQRVKGAFEKRGLDPFEIGVLCYDKWDDIFDNRQVFNESGAPIIDEMGHPVMETVLIKPAGEIYGIRYEEAMVLECAYLRSRLKK